MADPAFKELELSEGSEQRRARTVTWDLETADKDEVENRTFSLDDDEGDNEGAPMLARSDSYHISSERLAQVKRTMARLDLGLRAALVVLAAVLVFVNIRGWMWDVGAKTLSIDNMVEEQGDWRQYQSGLVTNAYGAAAEQIMAAALAGAPALLERLQELCYTFGPRPSGSPALADAINWVEQHMQADGLEKVHRDTVTGVSNWTRGEELVEMLAPRKARLSAIGLGGTAAGDVTATIITVHNMTELSEKRGDLSGRIVFFNVRFTTYGETVQYRYDGPTVAATMGAVAVLLRSVGPFSMGNPHTGITDYSKVEEMELPRVPAVAISDEDADMLEFFAKTKVRTVVRVLTSGHLHAPAVSHNVMAEITGRELPNEVVTIGGHLDSWDVGLGAMDDGGGMLVCWESVRLLKSLNLRPRRTIRVVAFVNEETGGYMNNSTLGGRVYAENHRNETHVLAIESDYGTFAPEGFSFRGPDSSFETVRTFAASLLSRASASEKAPRVLNGTDSGADVTPLVEMYGTPAMELLASSDKYFWYHHSVADTPDKLNMTEMAQGAAAIAIMAYSVAEAGETLMPFTIVRSGAP